MSFVISSVNPFPRVSWWIYAQKAGWVKYDVAEHFQKMTFRNRYHIGGGNGMIKLSIPIQKGRDQRTPMNELKISYAEDWQKQHWRTLFSAYNRSPFFEYYRDSLHALLEEKHELLIDFNSQSIRWVKQQLKINFGEEITDIYQPKYENVLADLRYTDQKESENSIVVPEYYQVFEDRNGFLPDLSILDLVFSEGPHTSKWLVQQAEKIS